MYPIGNPIRVKDGEFRVVFARRALEDGERRRRRRGRKRRNEKPGSETSGGDK
jgi:hypothetical protein